MLPFGHVTTRDRLSVGREMGQARAAGLAERGQGRLPRCLGDRDSGREQLLDRLKADPRSFLVRGVPHRLSPAHPFLTNIIMRHHRWRVGAEVGECDEWRLVAALRLVGDPRPVGCSLRSD
ncbi:hypothetical protein OG389_00480 [Streptomyces sp. NBC_00435]|uniref:hypothetical protein n=1 Tax=Streptomyces sp. NBC_00435 TaxID=2903649 RepID=UPI002E1E315C